MSGETAKFEEVHAEPIDHGTLGRVPILEEEDLQVVFDATGLDLLPEVNRMKFLHWLNNTVERTIRAQLTARLDRKALKNLTTSVRSYRDLSLLHSDFPPPLLPPNWLAEVEEWIEEANQGLSDRKSGGAPRNVETTDFLTKALGLFHAGFGIEPESTASYDKANERGAAFRFVDAVFGRARVRVAERGFSDRVPPELAARARWTPVTPDAMGKRIASALELRIDTEEWTGEGRIDLRTQKLTPIIRKKSGPAWSIHGARFRTLIARH